MKVPSWIAPVFYAAALYDGILGVLGTILPVRLYTLFGAALPDHMGYVHFPALLLILVSIMFYNIAKDPIANKNLIFYGILAKIAYCVVVLGYLLFGNIPSMWVPFAILDLLFIALFILAGRAVNQLGVG